MLEYYLNHYLYQKKSLLYKSLLNRYILIADNMTDLKFFLQIFNICTHDIGLFV